MAEIPTEIKSKINSLYDKRKESQLSQLRESQKKAVGELNQRKKTTDQEYYDKRNQADVGFVQNQRALAERMASLGQTGRNVSGQIALQSARQNTLGDLNEQEQGIMNAYNRQINQINDPSRKNSMVNELESQRSQMLAQALEHAIERARQQEQFEKQLAWEREKFNRLHSGGGSGSGGSSRSGSGGSAYLSDADLLDIMYKNSPQVVDAGDADRVLNEESVNRGQMNDYAAMEKAYRNRKSSRSGRLGGPRMIM